jgi:exonuclease VII large subunit
LCVAQSMRYSFNMQVYTVSQLTQYIKDVFEADPVLLDLWVEGEVSNCVQSAAGHMYFTLKDARACCGGPLSLLWSTCQPTAML